MPLAIQDFWKLVVASGLLPAARCRELHAQFAGLKGASRTASSTALAEWLVGSGILTRYQANAVLSGQPGTLGFGDLVIVDRIEAGRLAGVFRARYKGTQPLLVVPATLWAGERISEEDAEQRTVVLAAVKHPHVMRVHRYVSGSPQGFVVTQDLAGRCLGELLSQGTPPLDVACRIAFHAALGLAALREQRLAHGRLWPENIWVDTSGAARLLQFPLATSSACGERPQAAWADYQAPEVAESPSGANQLADVYSLGCLLHELISGRVPFPGGTAAQKAQRHERELPQRLDERMPDVPEELATLVADMLDKETRLRTPSAAAIAQALVPFTVGASSASRVTPPKGATGTGESAFAAPPAVAVVVAPAEIEVGQPSSEVAFVDARDEMFVTKAGAKGSASRAKRSSNSTLIGVAIAVALMALALLFGLLWNRSGKDDAPAKPTQRDVVVPANAGDVAGPNIPSGGATESPPAPAPPAGEAEKATDDKELLWASPTSGQPLKLTCLPPGVQMIIVLRPAELLAGDEGPKLLDALGPAALAEHDRALTTLGLPAIEIEQLVIAQFSDDAGALQTAYVMRLVAAPDRAALVRAWGSPTASMDEGQERFEGPVWAYYFPPEDEGRVVAVAPRATMPEVIATRRAPLLHKSLERLLPHSDAARHINVMAPTAHWLADNGPLVALGWERLREPLRQFLDKAEAVAWSMQLGEDTFFELRAIAPGNARASDLSQMLQQRVEQMPDRVESYVASLDVRPYGRLVVNRLPRMVQLMSAYTRAGVDGNDAVLRCYLPAPAAHNLLLATQLALLEQPAAAGSRVPSAPVALANDAPTALEQVISLSFPRDTLEHSMELLSQQIGVPITILGTDLQLEGITKNQSFGLNERDKPAKEILSTILKLASPDGKLVYVVKTGEGAAPAITITTRAAAARRGEAVAP